MRNVSFPGIVQSIPKNAGDLDVEAGQAVSEGLSSRDFHDQIGFTESSQVLHEGGHQQIGPVLCSTDLTLSHAESFSELHLG